MRSTHTSSTGCSESDCHRLGLAPIWGAAEKEYRLEGKIGAGSFGTVIKAKCKATDLNVAIKLIENFGEYDYDSVKVVREVQLLRRIHAYSKHGSSSYFPEIIDTFLPEDESEDNMKSIFVVMEFEQTDLRKLLRLGTESHLEEDHIILIFYNLLCALKYMHSMNIVHRDIKPSNILINKDCQVKICDMGLARTLPASCVGSGSGNSKRIRESLHKQNMAATHSRKEIQDMVARKITDRMDRVKSKKRSLSSHVSSRWYRAPEISLLEKHYDYASDIWSLGCCFYELLRILSEANGGPSSQVNRILVPGDCCYPLSPKSGAEVFTEEDQLTFTIKQIGQQSEADLSFISTSDAKKYMTILNKKHPQKAEGRPYMKDLVGVNPKLVEIVDNMLMFNPYFRWSPAECLKSDIFDGIRRPKLEKPATTKLALDVDSDEAFDYSTSKSLKFSRKDYFKMLMKEVKEVRDHRKEYLSELTHLKK